ncbi:major facilitator superfamily transporter [Macrophomina phaseolina]|uniref:Major facilitator superfamily transporter n=1 Tax=Macrophomina phaseolina TaxID=35725 RepID=A0ABQ8GJQ7_9PEZI|nr:major facilitator superfamily transporter [Macrophomina phaseolina]
MLRLLRAPLQTTQVSWDGQDDPKNPKNWSLWRKWTTTLLSSLGGLVTLMSGAMMAPALADISNALDITPEESQIALKPIWIASSACYVTWNVICGFSTKQGTMVASRFFSGIGASAQFAISFPVLSDCWKPDQRGKSFAIATFIPLLGSAVGSIVGGIITERIGWRWLFWVLAAFNAFLILLTFIFFSETYGQTVLRRRAKGLRTQTGRGYRTDSYPLLLACNFGILFIVLSTFATMWIDRYGQTQAASGLNYLALVIGYTVAAQVGGPATDRIWAHMKRKHGGSTAPEYRVPLMIPSVLLIPAGLLIYGWAAPARPHWVVPDVGIGAMQAYVMDALAEHTASASAASQFLRNVFAFASPIFAPRMDASLRFGWGNSLLAFMFLTVGVLGPFVLRRYGAKLRQMGNPLQ